MKNKIWDIIKFSFILVSFVVSGLFIRIMYKLDVIPSKYYWIIVILLIILNIFGIIGILSEKLLARVASFPIYIFVIALSLIGINYGTDTLKFLNNNFNNNNIEVNGYNIIVLKESDYERIDDLTDKSMGYLSTDPEDRHYMAVLKGKVSTDLKSYDDLYKLYNDLIDKKIESIILGEGYLDILEEAYNDLSDKIKIIDSFQIESRIKKTEEQVEKLEPINVYISGSDSRSGNIVNKSRSDVNMIITINPNTKKILLTSIPRDYYVQLHGTKGIKDKLTHAGIYGIDMSKSTIEDTLNIKIDYTVKVGFNSVIKLVDLIDGVDIESDLAFTTYSRDGGAVRTEVKKGMNHFNGAQALSYSRERYAYKEGDRHRIQNQQQVLVAIMQKITTNKSLLLKYDTLLKSIGELYRTDIPDKLIKMFVKNQLNNMTSWNIENQTVDGKGSNKQTYSMPGRNLYVMVPDEKSIKDATNKINKVLKGE